jgi:hypothetical protein
MKKEEAKKEEIMKSEKDLIKAKRREERSKVKDRSPRVMPDSPEEKVSKLFHFLNHINIGPTTARSKDFK